MKILLERGADINQAGYNEQTPLMVAVGDGHLEVVEVLLEYGPNLNATTEDEGDTAFDMINHRVFPEIAPKIETLLNEHILNPIITKTVKRQQERDTFAKEMEKRNASYGTIDNIDYLGGRRKTKKSKRSQKNRISMKNKHSVRK